MAAQTRFAGRHFASAMCSLAKNHGAQWCCTLGTGLLKTGKCLRGVVSQGIKR